MEYDCTIITHPKDAFSIHICSHNQQLVRCRIYPKLWSEWDANLSDGIIVPDEELCMEVPNNILMDRDMLGALQHDLLNCQDAVSVMAVAVKYGIPT